MKRDENIEAVRSELQARGLGHNFDDKSTWKNVLTLLKTDEGGKKYFYPALNISRYDKDLEPKIALQERSIVK